MVYLTRIAVACLAVGLARSEAATYSDSGSNAYQCRLPVKASDLLNYVQNPADMLRDLPSGGENLTWRIRTIATAGSEGLKLVGRLFRLANLNQKQAIGEGLARAASSCESLNSEVTTHIADMLRGSGDHDVIRAFTTFLSNQETTSAEASVGAADTPLESFARLPSVGRVEDAGAYFRGRIDTRDAR